MVAAFYLWQLPVRHPAHTLLAPPLSHPPALLSSAAGSGGLGWRCRFPREGQSREGKADAPGL